MRRKAKAHHGGTEARRHGDTEKGGKGQGSSVEGQVSMTDGDWPRRPSTLDPCLLTLDPRPFPLFSVSPCLRGEPCRARPVTENFSKKLSEIPKRRVDSK